MTRLLLSILTIILLQDCIAQPLTTEQGLEINRLLNWLVQEENDPGLAIGIIRQGEVVFEQYKGVANRKSEAPITGETHFNIASNGKQFTALCILQLVEEGKLSLEDDFRTYLPGYYPAVETPITIAQLLTHTSGIRDVYDLWGLQGIVWWKARGLNNEVALRLLKQQRTLNFEPGTAHRYSNSNYLLLTKVVEVTSNESFKSYADQFFRGLGMDDSFFLDDHRERIDNYANPYFDFGEWVSYQWRSDLHGDGTLFTTLPDQMRWEVILQENLSSAQRQKLLSASQQRLTQSEEFNYGYGLEFGTYRDLPYLFHDGSTGAWRASFWRFPEQELSIVVMTNSGKVYPPELIRRVTNIVLKDLLPAKRNFPFGPEINNDQIITDEELLGTYLLSNRDGFYFRFVRKEGKLLMERSNRNPIEIERAENNLFQEIEDPDFKQFFTRNATNNLHVTAYYPTHDAYTLDQVPPLEKDFDFRALEGFYVDEETGVRLQVIYLENQSYRLITKGKKSVKWEGELLTSGLLKMENYTISFQPVENGEIQELSLNGNRIRNVRFVKKKS